jgi:hypothetical protein
MFSRSSSHIARNEDDVEYEEKSRHQGDCENDTTGNGLLYAVFQGCHGFGTLTMFQIEAREKSFKALFREHFKIMCSSHSMTRGSA